MCHTRIAGGEYTIASCGHPIRPGECYVASDMSSDIHCWACYQRAADAQLHAELVGLTDRQLEARV